MPRHEQTALGAQKHPRTHLLTCAYLMSCICPDFLPFLLVVSSTGRSTGNQSSWNLQLIRGNLNDEGAEPERVVHR